MPSSGQARPTGWDVVAEWPGWNSQPGHAVGGPDKRLARILKRDPHVAAGPIVLAASDMLTLLLYFNFARWLLA